MKAKSKPLAQKTPDDYGVDIAARLKTLKVVEPSKRQAGVKLDTVEPVAGPNWTALEGRLLVRYGPDGKVVRLLPQSRSFWTPPQQTSESALLTRWNGQLYAVLGGEAPGADADDAGRWQLRLWWKPFVPLIWLGGVMIALGGVLALIGHVLADVRRIIARGKIAYRRQRQGR
jgi:cytochrome c-type biogenesis protein CcmF